MGLFDKRIAVAWAAATWAGLAPAQGDVGLGIDHPRARLDCTGADACDKTGRAWRLHGGHPFTPRLAQAAAYGGQGTARVTGSGPELGRLDGAVRGHLIGRRGLRAAPGEAATFHAQLGVVSSRIAFDARSLALGSALAAERPTGGAWGLGLRQGLAATWTARRDYERLRARLLDEKLTVDLLTLGGPNRF